MARRIEGGARLRGALLALGVLAVASSTTSAVAQPKAPPPPTPAPAQPSSPEEEAKKTEARQLFSEGVEHVKKFQWAEALSAFERSHALVQNAITSLNIGVSERALGRYVRARRSLERALAENDKGGGKVLSDTSLADAKGYIAEIDGVIVRTKVTIRPSDAAISVDGRPLTAISADKKTFASGVAAPGPGEPAPAETFDMILDPGNHVFVLSRKGFSDQVVNRTLSPSKDVVDLVFELEKLPARIKISSSVGDAIVRVGTVDVGPAPVDVLRPAGSYPVRVQKEGYVPYETSLSVKAGEESKLNAVLVKKSFNVAEQWWFWTSIAGALGTAAVVTYFVVRPEPDPPPYNGGTTGWVVEPSGFRF